MELRHRGLETTSCSQLVKGESEGSESTKEKRKKNWRSLACIQYENTVEEKKMVRQAAG